ncbi:MAG TPA: hypothetical protein VLO13_07500 [Halomonas sp.]|nr:hypothetical protein [Halomonas sp.]
MRDGRGRNLIAIPTIIPEAHIDMTLSLMATMRDGHRDLIQQES